MERNEIKEYIDTAQTWPDKTVEEHDELIREADEESKCLKEWPKT